ncbi:MAG: hypothetical protein IJ761_01040 [Bacteroidales bacterium]|nr:hypothetical protein [Bacteroidales bacterium]
MKRFSIILVALATLTLASCSIFQSSSSNAAAQAAGQSCGYAVQGLYNNYKSTGTLNLNNASNLTNALTVVTSYNLLKNNQKDASYKKSFVSGMVASSAGLLTTQTATSFVDQLMASQGLNNINSSNITQTVNTANTIVTLLKALNN